MKAFSKIFLAAGAAVALSATLALAADSTPRNAAGCPGAAYSGQMGQGMRGSGYGHRGYGHMTADRMGHGRNGHNGMMRNVSATNADSYRMGPRAAWMSGGAGRAI